MSEKDTPKKVYLKSWGCQMNVRDSEALSGLLKNAGYRLVDSEQAADAILLNTCSVRQHAEDKVWSEIGRLNKIRNPKSVPITGSRLCGKIRNKSQFPNPKLQNKQQTTNYKRPIIGVIGCMAQNYKEEIFKRTPYVDLVVGPNDLSKVPLLIKQAIKERTHTVAVGTKKREQGFYASDFRQDTNHAYVVISEGCNNFCSYCVVPYVRGELRCRDYRDILDEIERAVGSGIRNITLLGQNVNDYESSEYRVESREKRKINFVELLDFVSDIKGIRELNFITSHPKDIDFKLFDLMAKKPNIKQCLHLPVQSGSDRILKSMNRRYTRKRYLEIVKRYRREVPEGILSTDIIVGFPSETEKDFKDTLELVKKIEFDSAYIFKYSPRPRTKAKDLTDDIPRKEKERRHKILLDLQKEISRRKKTA